MRNFRTIVLFLASISLVAAVYAAPPVRNNSGAPKGVKNVSSGCAPGNATANIDLNNVKALIGTRGGKWTGSGAAYEIPKGSLRQSIYAGGIWVAGVDVNGQLRVAARTFTSGGKDDYWPGPLVSKGDNLSNVTAEVCNQYDRLWKVDRDMVSKFIAWYNADAESRERDYPGYSPPLVIQQWPGNGPDFGSDKEEYDRYLAPYADVDGNGRYNVDGGDYPNYEFTATTRCKFIPERRADSLNNTSVTLYGDQTIWWVYNDKGNIHSETQGAAIGMEVRGQAFAFSTNDELNNMTFYNYQLINRSTYRLNNAYFGVWVDADVGDYDDDVVGCDINRGLSFAYNGDDMDGDGSPPTYGANPPAVGFDFFEGPYQDENDSDDPSNWPGLGEIVPDCQNGYRDSLDLNGEILFRVKTPTFDIYNGNINGLNFGDQIKDNERWGMRRFVYHKKESGTATGDPAIAIDYYNYLRGIWLDGTPMTYGGSGYGGTLKAEFMFPWRSDECNWGTGGTDPGETDPGGWKMTEPVDGRLLQSAGPFVLMPGATNYITIGVPWARTNTGNREHSVELLKLADDKCQKLFENCFRMIEGPHAPDMTAVELNGQFIIHLSNPPASNNYLEKYSEVDPFIPPNVPADKKKYNFQGYQVFQLKHKDVTINQIYDTEYSKLVFQCDLEDNIDKIVNFTWDADANANSYQIMVRGENKGIRHSFEINFDMFATSGSSRLVNYKKYYYVAIAYAYNNFKTYNQNDGNALDGQKIPYLASRKATTGEIKKYEFVPRPAEIAGGGTIINAQFGDMPAITYLSGRGNSTNPLDLTDETIAEIMTSGGNEFPWKAQLRKYKKNGGPVNVKVVDPLNVVDGNFILYIEPDSIKGQSNGGLFGQDYIFVLPTGEQNTDNNGLILNSKWTLIRNNTDTLRGPLWMRYGYEYILPEYGIAINMYQSQYPVFNASSLSGVTRIKNGMLGASITYENPAQRWFTGLPDGEGQDPRNWIRAGTITTGAADVTGDPEQEYEKILGGTWAPYKFTSTAKFNPGNSSVSPATINFNQYRLPSIDFVITKDSSKWTRCIVIETCENTLNASSVAIYPNPIAEGGARKFMLRQAPSLNKNGVPADSMNMEPSDNPNDPNYISAYGMSWFPGYAIDVETGERLNIAFGEDSYLVGQNGRDMIWNPTSAWASIDGTPQFGGKHYVYVFSTGFGHTSVRPFPRYDAGQKLFQQFHWNGTGTINTAMTRIGQAMLNAAWVTIPMISRQYQWKKYSEMPNNEVKVKIRIGNPYHRNVGIYQDSIQDVINKGYPYFTFSLDDLAATRNSRQVVVDALDRINVVPNPYIAHNQYERSQLENVVKITNLPRDCNVKIFNFSGTLIREFSKSSDQTWIDWNLTNTSDVPIAGGVYIIHVSVPNVGEKVLKWFGVLRPADLSNF
jgi:hypothetical protein